MNNSLQKSSLMENSSDIIYVTRFDCVPEANQDPLSTFWIGGVLISVVGIFGLIGNVLSILILLQPKLRKGTFNQLLVSLAVFDIICILSRGIWYTTHSFCGVHFYITDRFLCFTHYARLWSLIASVFQNVA